MQKELTELCGYIMKEKIVRRAIAARSYAVIVYETTDTAKTEQVSLC